MPAPTSVNKTWNVPPDKGGGKGCNLMLRYTDHVKVWDEGCTLSNLI